jgi:hypothetical protein
MATDAEIDRLYQLPLGEFTAARDALAKSAGDRRGAIKQLEKPNAAAWGVNQLYWQRRKFLDRLIAAFEHVRAAQASRMSGKAANLGEAEAAHRLALDRAAAEVRELLLAAGDAASPATMAAVRETLQVLPFSPVDGRLTRPLQPVGFSAFAGLMGAPSGAPKRQAEVIAFAGHPHGRRAAQAEVDDKDSARDAARRAKAAEKKRAADVARAERDVREAREAERGAAARATRAAADADKALTHRDRLREQLETAEDDLRKRRADRDRAAMEAKEAAMLHERLEQELERLRD